MCEDEVVLWAVLGESRLLFLIINNTWHILPKLRCRGGWVLCLKYTTTWEEILMALNLSREDNILEAIE